MRDLLKYRMVRFATHGVLAGQLDGTREPGLILTPPKEASEVDDGYLSASEIAGLKLDADWLILSACNTAPGAATNAEALSGLARAFIYALARALLVSYWAVYSDARVKLITTAIREMARDPVVPRPSDERWWPSSTRADRTRRILPTGRRSSWWVTRFPSPRCLGIQGEALY